MLTATIVEDHPIFREALRQLLTRNKTDIRIWEVATFDEVVSRLEENPHVDVMLLDLEIPGAQGFSALAHVHYNYPDVRIAVVSGHDDPSVIRRSIQLGAEAFIPKTLPLSSILEALTSFLEGRTWTPEASTADADPESSAPGSLEYLAERVGQLTPQQRRVVMGMARGRLNKQIAYDLGITEGTVKNHVTSILRQLSLRRRTEVVAEVGRLMQMRQERERDTWVTQSREADAAWRSAER